MTAGATLLDLIGERTPAERAPAVRAFAQAFLRRLAADEDGEGPLVTEVLCGEIVGLFEFASARGEAPIAVRAFNPSLDEHGYETPGSVVETNTEDWPFLVTPSPPSCAPASSASGVCCTRSSASSAAPRARSP